jgi:Putative prokaryotic signal transducing protein
VALALVTTVADELEADIVAGLLESEGIASFVKRTADAAPGGTAGSIDDTGRIEIWVDESDLVRATELAAPADEPADEPT